MSRRDEDLKLLNELLDTNFDGLSEKEVGAFTDMRSDLQEHRFIDLTEKQREWVKGAHARVGAGACENLVSRELVPRGREVAPAPVLLNLPKSPPGRKNDTD